MKLSIKNTSLIISSALILITAPNLFAQQVCSGYGPQNPRDIDQTNGDNKRVFSLAPPSNEMNLCNIHFHNSAEHKAKDFSISAGEGEHGGFKCAIGETLSKAELKPTKGKVCKNLTG